jgi:hypothetical protein
MQRLLRCRGGDSSSSTPAHPHACFSPRALPAVRQDPNPQLKQGVVGAFVITRALAMLQASEDCSALPLSCGAPLGSAHLFFLFTALPPGGLYGSRIMWCTRPLY